MSEFARRAGESPRMTTGEKLAAKLAESGISQRELAERAKVDQAHISRYINGLSEPRAATLKRLAEALDCAPEALAGDPPPETQAPKTTLSRAIVRVMEAPGASVKFDIRSRRYSIEFDVQERSPLGQLLGKLGRAVRYRDSAGLDAEMYSDIVNGLCERFDSLTKE